MSTASTGEIERVVHTIARTCVANEHYFSELDAVAGDGDFGSSLARGFEKVLANWDSYDRADPGAFLTQVAATITSSIGGTSGPIWGTAFLRAGTALRQTGFTSASDVIAALRAAIAGIKTRGGAQVGDKTLLDALVPATDRLEREVASDTEPTELFTAFAETARAAADSTAALVARRGRASYTGERSRGSVDAGATAVAVLAEALAADATK